MAAAATIWSSGIPWDQEPKYVAACQCLPQPGDPIAYKPPRNHGSTPTDITGFQVGSAHWNMNNLPNIFYFLWPCTEWTTFARSPRPAQKIDANGNLMFERHPWPGTRARPILDYPILRAIDTICTEVEWQFIEWLFRMDGRLTWDDIDMRTECAGKKAGYYNKIDLTLSNVAEQVKKEKHNFINHLNMKCRRGRVQFNMISWRDKKGSDRDNPACQEVLNRLSPQQKLANITRGTTPGLIDVNAPDTAANRVPLPGSVRRTRQPQAAPIDFQQIQPAAIRNAYLQAQNQGLGPAQPQVLPANVLQFQPPVAQHPSLLTQSQAPSVVLPQPAQPNAAHILSAAPHFPTLQNQPPAPSAMATSQSRRTQQNYQQVPPTYLQQTQPPPSPYGALQSQPQGLGDVSTVQQYQVRQPAPQYTHPNFQQSRPAATPALQTSHQVPAAMNTPRPNGKRTASSAFADERNKNGEIRNLDDEEYDVFEPAHPTKRAKTDSSGLKSALNNDTDEFDDIGGGWSYQGLSNVQKTQDNGLGASRPPLGGISAGSRGGTPGIKDGKRKREPDKVLSPYEDNGRFQQLQGNSTQPTRGKRQKTQSLSSREDFVLPELTSAQTEQHWRMMGQQPAMRHPESKSSSPSSRDVLKPSGFSPLSQFQTSRKPSLGNQPTGMGPYGAAGPHVQMKQHQAYGDDYTDPYSQTRPNSRPLYGRQGPQWNHQKNRQPGHPSILAPKADTQRIQKNSPQLVPPGRNSSNQHFLANLDHNFAARNAFEQFETLRPGSQPAGIEDYGAARPNNKVTQNLRYVNNGYGPVSLPQTPSRPGAGADHSSPPPYLTPTNNRPSSSLQHTPQVGSETSRGPDSTPSKFNGSAYGVNSQPTGIYDDPTHGPGTTQSDIDIQERIALRDEANAILLPQEDDDGRRISEGQPKDQSDDIDAASSHESLNVLRGSNGSIEKVEGPAATSAAPYEVDEGFFERYLENGGRNQTLTGGIEVPGTLNTDSGVSEAEIEEWTDQWLKENDTQPQQSTGGVDGNNAGHFTANAPPPQGAHLQPSSRKVGTEEPSADEFQTKYFDATKPSTWTAEEWKFFGEPFSGPENLTDRHLEILKTMRILQLPFDVSKFPHEDYLWFLEQSSPNIF